MATVDIKDNYINDFEFDCPQCENKGVCFSTIGETQFCSNCGFRFGDE